MATAPAYIRHRDHGLGADTVHLFCGVGGDAQGMREAGFNPVLGANHSSRNIETFGVNFPDAATRCVDLDHYDMRNLVRARGLVASPICTETTPAGGIKAHQRRAPGQADLLEELGHVPAEQFVRTRATAFDIIRATEAWNFDFVLCENVIEFATRWPLFDWWLDGFRRLDYNPTVACVSAAHVSSAGNNPAPQWRDRLVIAFTRTGLPLPDLEPRPVAPCPEHGDVPARQAWRRPGVRIGKYGRQYDYACPFCRRLVEPYVMPAISVLDLSDLGPRIGDRRRTPAKPEGLAPASIARIRDGLLRQARGEFDTPPLLPPYNTGDGGDPFLAILRNHATGVSARAPMPTVATGGGKGGGHHAMVTPPEPFLAMLRGNARARSAREPLTTITAAGGASQHAMVMPYYSNGVAKPVTAPLDTVTTKARLSLVSAADMAAVSVADCRMRMLRPREYAAGHRFPDNYTLTGNQGEQIAGIGNAVPVNVSCWAGQRVMAALEGSNT